MIPSNTLVRSGVIQSDSVHQVAPASVKGVTIDLVASELSPGVFSIQINLVKD